MDLVKYTGKHLDQYEKFPIKTRRCCVQRRVLNRSALNLEKINGLCYSKINMAVPKKRSTKSRRDKRRANIFLPSTTLGSCPRCGKLKLPHAICQNCGYYKGEEVVNVLQKLEKKERKKREKEIKEKERGKEEVKKERPLTMEELSRKKF